MDLKRGKTMYTIAIIFQILVFLYFEITTLINLFPWNDVSKYSATKMNRSNIKQNYFTSSHWIVATKTGWGMGISLLFWVFFFILQILTWWMPYLTGKHLKQFPRQLYYYHFSRTVKFFPHKKSSKCAA